MKKVYLSIVAGLLSITFLMWTPKVAQPQGTGASAFINEVIPTKFNSNGFPQMQISIAVLSTNGLHQAGLTAKDFTLTEENRAAVAVEPVQTQATAPVAICLAIDISDSMGKSKNPATGRLFIEDARAAAEGLISKLNGDRDRACLIAFGDKDIELGTPLKFDPARERDFTKNNAELQGIKEMLRGLQPDTGRRTALYDATLKAIKATASQQFQGARAVVLFTDGKDERIGADGTTRLPGSVTTFERLLDGAKDARIPVFTIGIGDDVDPTNLKRIAEVSGASYQAAPTPNDLAKPFDDILTQLRTQYVVRYNSYLCPDGRNHALQVRVRTPGGEADTRANFTLALPPQAPAVCLYYREGDERKELTDGQTLRGTVTLAPQIVSSNPISLTVFIVDDKEEICRGDRAPFTCEWNTNKYPEGKRSTIIVRAQDTTGRIGQASANVITQPLPIWDQLPLWAKIPLLVIPVLLFLALLILIATRARRASPVYCPRGLHVMPPGATTCPFCAVETEKNITPTPLPQPRVTEPLESTETGTPSASSPMPTIPLEVQPVNIAFLVMEQGTHPGKQFTLHGTDTTIGRAGMNDIVVDDPTVGRQQAKIKLEGKEYFLYDLAATNPCRVNGKEVKGRRKIVENDRIEMGNVVFVFKIVQGKKTT